MAKPNLTAERLREVLSYDPETGLFVRKICFQRPDVIGTTSLLTNGNGYLRIAIDGKRYLCHRLVWLYMVGTWPQNEIDHMDGNRSNNKWSNLRDVTPRHNQQNKRKAHSHSKSQILGVSWDKSRGKWTARIKTECAYKYLGRFDSVETAKEAYLTAKRLLHPGCTI